MFRVMARAALAAAMTITIAGAVVAQQLPAVSALNGKFEFDAGALTLPAPGFAGRAAGATGWLVKPFDPAKLIEVIGKVIR